MDASSKYGIDFKSNKTNYAQIFVLENIYWLQRNLEKTVYRPKNIIGSGNSAVGKDLDNLKSNYIDDIYFYQFDEKLLKECFAKSPVALQLKKYLC